MPLEVAGKRERHKVDRISITNTPTVKRLSTIPMGDGVPLGDIAYSKSNTSLEVESISQ